MSRRIVRSVLGCLQHPIKPLLGIAVAVAWGLLFPDARGAPPMAALVTQDPSAPQIEPERAQFRTLILNNPNHFGNVPDSTFQPVVTTFKSNTTYEEIGCVGYQPQFSFLEAVVYVKKPFGYGGGLCAAGTPEYVRFYVDWNNDNDWKDPDEDMGLTSFTAHDIPGEQRLEYAVTLRIDPKRVTFCFTENLPKVRAILSWNVPPPPNTPGFIPVWGNVVDATVQIQPRRLIIFADLFKEIKATPPAHFDELVDLTKPMPVAEPKILDVRELQALYRGKEVPPHRFGFAEAQKWSEQTILTEKLLAPGSKGLLPGLEIKWSDLFGQIQETNGDTRFEELKCIGLNPDQDTLVGIVTVKLPNGFSGNLCQAGSREYVAFWIDYGSGLTYAGTTSVTVHDLNSIPPGGVQYAVFLPVDLNGHRQPCELGAKNAKVRAILSWQAPPPPANPDYVPTWGNRLETTIQIEPGPKVEPGVQVPILSSVGDIPVDHINSSGLGNGTGSFTGFVAVDSPFGGMINLAGKIVNGSPGSKYRVMKKPHGAPDSAYVPLTDEPDGLKITLVTFNGGLNINSGFTIHADANGYYTYQDYASNHYIEGNILMRWYSTALEDGNQYDLRIDLNVDGNPAHDIHSNEVTVLVDNTRPVANINIDLMGGVDCADFTLGATFNGTFTATDSHFKDFSFVIRPPGPAHGVLPSPSSGSYPVIPDPGVASGTYTLNTGGNPGPPKTGPMDACGYALTIQVRDRTNLNSGAGNYSNEASVGFCLRKP